MFLRSKNLPKVSKMYIPSKSAIWAESNDPIVTSTLLSFLFPKNSIVNLNIFSTC